MKNLFLLAILFFVFSLSAQTRGTVIDSLGMPIPYVNIWVDGENIGTTSQEDGTFTLNSSKEKVLVFSAVGFETRRTSVKEDEKIILKSKIHQLDEVAIYNLKNTKEIEVGEAKKYITNFYQAINLGFMPSYFRSKNSMKKHPS
jgi:hypothetical protein